MWENKQIEQDYILTFFLILNGQHKTEPWESKQGRNYDVFVNMQKSEFGEKNKRLSWPKEIDNDVNLLITFLRKYCSDI